jgi:acyl-CoA synthetase (AMP-forming)/AMP-acid ligase II
VAENANIARHLDLMAAAQPHAPAIKVPRGRSGGRIDYVALTFAELSAEAGAWRARLEARGVRRGDRTLVAVRPGLPLIACAFALFRIGAVPVVIDPGMGWRSFLACVERSKPRAVVGIPVAQVISRVFRKSFRSVEVRVTASGSLTARLAGRGRDGRLARPFLDGDSGGARTGGPPVPTLEAPVPTLETPVPTSETPVPTSERLCSARPDELAAILFTSGSTGRPKGVRYEHGMFEAQIALLREAYRIEPGEVDLPMLPIFALFNPALGMTTVVPEIDPRRPAEADPSKIVQAILQENVTNSFGSPTLWRIIGDHCRKEGIVLPSLRRVLCAGAPVPSALWQDSRSFIPNGLLHSPYGATEALPVSTINSTEALALSSALPSSGAPVGRPLPGISVKIIAISDDPIATLAQARELGPGEVGEIIVSGLVVTKEYDALPEATALAKIKGSGPEFCTNVQNSGPDPVVIWHRMGDCGYLDAQGMLWFCGRKAERVDTEAGTMHTEPVERVFRKHPRAARCALIGLGEAGRQQPALVVEAKVKSAAEARALAEELRKVALGQFHTAAIGRFFFHPRLPVDVRHNAKIHRLALARWAAGAGGLRHGKVKQ